MRKVKSGSIKKIIGIVILVVAVAAAGVWFWKNRQGDAWVCKGGKWTAKGSPKSPMPRSQCKDGDIKPDIKSASAITEKKGVASPSQGVAEGMNIKITSPTVNSQVTSPLKITGEAKGWYGDGSFPVKIVDDKGAVLADGVAKADGDWEADAFVPFEANLTFNAKESQTGDIIFQRSNPTQAPEKAGSFSFGVSFKK